MDVLYAKNLSLADVEARFDLREEMDPSWFREYRGPMPELSLAEQQWLDQVRSDFLAISKHPLHEEIVKLVVLAPLLSLAGLCRPPFLPAAERSVEIAFEDSDEMIRGRVDILVLHRQMWVTTIEAKRKGLDISEALPQALFYMLNAPGLNVANRKVSGGEQPQYGLVTNGSHFVFIKLVVGESPVYALSQEFSVRREDNELYQVLGILKRLGAIATQTAAA